MKIPKKRLERIGILGGTFDPPHIGHLKISLIVIKKLKLKYLIWAITKKNPFKKKPFIDLNRRIILSKKIIRSNRKIKIKSYDKQLKSSHTINLINFLKRKNKKSELFFLMGSDNIPKFHKWKKWKDIASLCQIIIFPRTGTIKKSLFSKAFRALGNKNLIFLRSKMINISSSKIRKNYLKLIN